MNPDKTREILESLKEGKLEVEEALGMLKEALRILPFSDLGFAKIDHHRELRKGFPEVILCLGKTPVQVKKIVRELLSRTQENLLATKANRSIYEAIKEVSPQAKYHPEAKLVIVEQQKTKKRGEVLVTTGGTADLPVAEEAALTAETTGSNVRRLYDVGVAGVHRLLAYQEGLHKARVIVAVAGMEGALPSLIAGIVSSPVIAVPTSIGYGTHLGGIAALLAMLNSCPPGIAVVNIDNGFGAGYLASVINKMPKQDS